MNNNFKDMAVIINSENISKLTKLYGTMDSIELQRIINRHLAAAIDDIFEDIEKNII